MNTIRCSALPLAWQCAESQNQPEGETLLNESSEPAEAGTAFHRWIAAHIGGTDLDTAKLAAEHGCDPDELSMLCHMGRKALTELRKHLDAADAPMMVEVPLETAADEFRLVGTGDLLGRSGRTALILDWKTGRVDSDHTHQTRGYALCAMDMLGEVDEAVVITVWVRHGVWDIEKISRAQLLSWASEFGRRLRNGRGNFNPGGHCQYCPRRLACPARSALVKATMAELSVEGAPVIPWTNETRQTLGPTIGATLRRVRMIEGVCEAFRAALGMDIGLYGPMDVGEGRQLALMPVNRRKLDAHKARPVLGVFDALSDTDIDAATTISLSQLEDAAAKNAGKGKGAQAKRDLTAALEAAGAISVNTTHQLREQKAPITQEVST